MAWLTTWWCFSVYLATQLTVEKIWQHRVHLLKQICGKPMSSVASPVVVSRWFCLNHPTKRFWLLVGGASFAGHELITRAYKFEFTTWWMNCWKLILGMENENKRSKAPSGLRWKMIRNDAQNGGVDVPYLLLTPSIIYNWEHNLVVTPPACMAGPPSTCCSVGGPEDVDSRKSGL